MGLLKYAWADPVIGISSHYLNKWFFSFDTPTPKLHEIEVPETEIGSKVKIIFGTKLIKVPHLVWYGDVKITKEDVDSGAKK